MSVTSQHIVYCTIKYLLLLRKIYALSILVDFETGKYNDSKKHITMCFTICIQKLIIVPKQKWKENDYTGLYKSYID